MRPGSRGRENLPSLGNLGRARRVTASGIEEADLVPRLPAKLRVEPGDVLGAGKAEFLHEYVDHGGVQFVGRCPLHKPDMLRLTGLYDRIEYGVLTRRDGRAAEPLSQLK